MLIFMIRSEDQAIHYEAVGVIGNLVHSSTHIKRRVLDEGALQPVIGLLSSECPESQREAALLLGQFATTEPEYKVKIVQRGAVQPLIQMLNNSDAALREMAAFALGRLAQNPDNQVGICHADGLRPLLDLLDSNAGNLQHNAAFALYGLADNEDNVPDIIKEGTVQRLKDGELIVQASKDCVQKTLKRLEDKMQGRVLQYLIYLMRTSAMDDRQRIAVALAHLCNEEDQRNIFMDQGGLDILLDMLAPPTGARENPYRNKNALPQNQKDAAAAMFIMSEKVSSLAPGEATPLPPTPEAYLEEHFNNPELSDITFMVNQQEFHAHKIAFAHASDAFHDLLDTGKVVDGEAAGGRYTIEISDMDYEVFDAMMRFIYTGVMTPVPMLAQDLLAVADKYQLDGLKRQCEAMLSQDLKQRGAEYPVDGVISLYQLAERFDAQSLGNACALYALEHHIRIIKAIGASEFSDLIIGMVPKIKKYMDALLYRAGNV